MKCSLDHSPPTCPNSSPYSKMKTSPKPAVSPGKDFLYQIEKSCKIYFRICMTMKKLFLLLSVLTCFPVCLVQAFEISEDTQIVTGTQAVDSTLFAARELAEYIFKAGGIKPAVVKGNSTALSQIVIGTLYDVKTLMNKHVRHDKSEISKMASVIREELNKNG